MDELTCLARAAGRVDHAALARLVRQTQGDVWRLRDYLVDPASADDLLAALEPDRRAAFVLSGAEAKEPAPCPA